MKYIRTKICVLLAVEDDAPSGTPEDAVSETMRGLCRYSDPESPFISWEYDKALFDADSLFEEVALTDKEVGGEDMGYDIYISSLDPVRPYHPTDQADEWE